MGTIVIVQGIFTSCALSPIAQQCLESSLSVMNCVPDALAPTILQNSSLSYFDKAALWHAKGAMADSFGGCPQLIDKGAVFTPGSTFVFYFVGSRVPVSSNDNATTMGVHCGLS